MKDLQKILLLGLLILVVGCQSEELGNDSLIEQKINPDSAISITDLASSGVDLQAYFGENQTDKSEYPIISTTNRSAITFSYNAEEFLAACPDLAFEDFSEAPLTRYDCFDAFPDPLDENTNYLFQPGDITSGVSFSAVDNKGFDDPADLATVTNCQFFPTVPSDIVLLANYSIDHLQIDFDPAVTTVGLDVMRLAGGEIELEIFGAPGSLGSTVVNTALNEKQYVGVQSTVPITHIILSTPNKDAAEVIDNLSFGSCDTDGDGCPDSSDPHPNSILDETVVIDGCDTGVSNVFITDCSTMADLIADVAASVSNHGQFIKEIKDLAKAWVEAGFITNPEKGQIIACASSANIP